jgi:hypothetical protein
MSQTETQSTSPVDQAQEKAGQAKSMAGNLVRRQVDSRSTQMGEQARTIAGALRQTSEQLRGEGQEQPSRLLEKGAESVERVAGYLEGATADSVVEDLERISRGRPWAIAGGAAVVGFVASRFVRASSERRYRSSGDGSGAYGGESFGESPSETTGRWHGADADLPTRTQPAATRQPS